MMTFRGKYDFLSNMYSVAFVWDGRTYQNSEAAFQSAKSLDPAVRDAFSTMNGVTAKREGKKVCLRRDWERVKLGLMEEIVRAKFSQNPDLLDRLVETGDMELVEGNRWHDTFWGVDMFSGLGSNHLGKILMKIREELGGDKFREKMRQEREQQSAETARTLEDFRAREQSIRREMESLPEVDICGMEMNTKAFGRGRIVSREGNKVKFKAMGTVKTFLYPDSIVQGFLIPDEEAVTESCQRRQELLNALAKLEKEVKAASFSMDDVRL